MTGTTEHDTIEAWLKAVGAELARLPDNARSDILNEARGHLEERLAAGLSAHSALHGFGTAKAYARNFVDQYRLDNALTHKRIIPMIITLAAFASRSVIAFFGLMFALTFGAVALASAVSIVLKTIKPDAVGLWVGPNQTFVLGTATNHVAAHEIAGNWVYLIFLAMIVVGGFLARASLIAAIRSIRGKMPILA